jgi:hypothetical protein
MNTTWSINEVKRYIDSFARPSGYNPYAWSVTKKLALEVWESYLTGRPFRRKVNYMCSEFYKMIERPDGESLLPRGSYRSLA